MNITEEKQTPPELLPGYIKKSFKMAFGGGEIWFEHLDGMYEHSGLVLQKLDGDKSQILRPSFPSLVSFNFDETIITAEIIDAVINLLFNTQKHFTRVCFTGADKSSQKQITRALKSLKPNFAFCFLSDFQKAKEWLVSENI